MEAVRTVAASEPLLAPPVLRRLVAHYVESPPAELARAAGLDDLSERELEVLRLIGRGLSNAEIGAELVPMGSAGAKVISVARDVTDAYVHAGGQYEWDSAAPVAVARAAGLHTSRIDGSELVYNQDEVLLPDLVVCRPELAEPILEFIRRNGIS